MKLQLEAYKKKYTVETENDGLEIYEYLDLFVGLLVQSGWHKQTINDAIIELAESIKED